MLLLQAIAQTLLGGLTAGSIYALVGVGVALIYKVSRVLNLAQGEFVAVGALVAFSLVSVVKLPGVLAYALAVLVLSGVGVLFERLAIRPARNESMTVLLVITLGTSLFLRGVAEIIWGRDPMSLPSFSGDRPLQVVGVAIQPQSLWILAGLLVTGVALWLFLERTVLGKAMLAAAENPAAARMIGINTQAMSRLGFALSAAVGALAGILVAPSTFITYNGGTLIGLKGFVAATILGMGSLPGAIAGGLILGVLEALSAGFVSSQYKDATGFLVLIVALVLRSGLDKREVLRQAAART